MTKPTMWLCAQGRLRSAWASAQSDQSLPCRHEETLVLSYPLSTQRDSDQTGRMPRLICVFAGRTLIFLVCRVAAHFFVQTMIKEMSGIKK